MGFTKIFKKLRNQFHSKYGEADVSIEIEEENTAKVYIDTKNLHLTNATMDDLCNYHQCLWGNQEIMATMANGQVRDIDYVEGRLRTWQFRSEMGNPYVGLKVLDKEQLDREENFVGNAVLGTADEPNAGELAMMTVKNYQGKGLTKEYMGAVIFDYSAYLVDHKYLLPEDSKIYSTPEEQQLEKLVATALASGNPASNTIFRKFGFKLESSAEKYSSLRNNYVMQLVDSDHKSFNELQEPSIAGEGSSQDFDPM